MAVGNSLSKQKPKFSVAIQQDSYKRLINNTLGDPKRAQRFIASVSSAVASKPALQECDAGSILSGALLGEALNLSPSPQLGQYFLVPYDDDKSNGKLAQFQLGYKGYIQLALRSGQYRRLNADAVKEGELIRFDPVREIIELKVIDDEAEREKAPTSGYYATFEYLNGFQKTIYWSREKMQSHAEKYSKAYKSSYSIWQKDFDAMALKTMLRQLISKWGIMSTELQSAIEGDMAVIHEDGKHEYVDNAEPLEAAAVQPEEPRAEEIPFAPDPPDDFFDEP